MENNSSEKELLGQFNKRLSEFSNDLLIFHAFNSFAESAETNVLEDLNEDETAVIGQRIWRKLPVASTTESLNRKLWLKYGGIAATVIFLTTFGFFIYWNNSFKIVNADEQALTIGPANNGAMLTLSNGEKIALSKAVNGKVAMEAGITVTKSASGNLTYKLTNAQKIKNNPPSKNTLSTGNGQVYSLILPDHSSVILNAASKITFSPELTVDGLRKVELEGEAYFEVAKDAEHPFVVKTSNQLITVLGTHFNVKAYPAEKQIKTTLSEGAVKLNAEETPSKNTLLKPGQVAINDFNSIKVGVADLDEELAWTKNDFFFRKTDTRLVMEEIARWYDVSVSYASEDIKHIEITGEISKTKKLTTVLERIGAATQLKFTISGRKVLIEKK